MQLLIISKLSASQRDTEWSLVHARSHAWMSFNWAMPLQVSRLSSSWFQFADYERLHLVTRATYDVDVKVIWCLPNLENWLDDWMENVG